MAARAYSRILHKEKKIMEAKIRKNWSWLIISVAIIVFSAVMAYSLERDFGKVDIQFVNLVAPTGDTIAAKLYRPVWVTAENPAPGIINMHGYQNDKDTQEPYSIELARRGFVVLATDGLGHADSGGRFNFGMFFGNPPAAMGTGAGYEYLRSLPFVDANKMGATGHSMGGVTSFALAGLYGDIKAIVSQDGGTGTPENSDVLFLQPTMAEFRNSMEPLQPVDPASFGLSEPVQWDTTYGDFADGTARRAALIWGDHHLMSIAPKGVAEAVDWFRLSLMDGAKDSHWIEPSNQIYMWKEVFGLLALLGTIISLIPLTNILLATTYFAPVAQPMPNRYKPSKGQWWILATINALLGGVLWLLFAYKGDVLRVLPFMNMLMGNGTALWFLLNAVVASVLIFAWYRTSAKKAGVTTYDLGFSFDKEKAKFDWGIIGKTVLLGVILFAWMYVLAALSQWALGEEFRFGWPFMRQFHSPVRVGYFLIYLIPALLFFLINGGVFLFGQARQAEYSTPRRSLWMWWLKILYAGLMGLFIVWALQYVPWMIAGTGPIWPQTATAGAPFAIWILMLWVYIPTFVVLLFMLTWFFRRTGRIYLGALMISMLVVWFLTAGSVIGV
jgi:pimeloyl-ACP methyl ester carboxylesterase